MRRIADLTGLDPMERGGMRVLSAAMTAYDLNHADDDV